MKKIQAAAIWKKFSRRKKILSVVLAAAVAGCGVGLPLGLKKTGKKAIAGQSMVQQASAKTADISNSIVGSGNLETDISDYVEIPSGIVIEEVKVESGDTVKKGDVLATVDQTSVLEAMEEVQDAIDEVDEELADCSTSSTTEKLKSTVSGTVKKIYASKGDKVTSCMAKHGALVVIQSSDGTKTSVTATGGTVSSLSVSAGDSISSGDTLLTLKTNGTSAEYLKLKAERKALVKSLKKLSAMSLKGTITAQKSGTIAEVNVSDSSETSSASSGTASGSTTSGTVSATKTAAAGNTTAKLVTLTTTSNDSETDSVAAVQTQSEDEAETNEVQNVKKLQLQIKESGKTTADSLVIASAKTGKTPQTAVQASDGSYTGTISWNPGDGTFQEDTIYKAQVTLQASDGYQFSADTIQGIQNGLVSGIQVSSDGSTLRFQVTFAKTSSQKQNTKTEQNTETDRTDSRSSDTDSSKTATQNQGSTQKSSNVSGTIEESGTSTGNSDSNSQTSEKKGTTVSQSTSAAVGTGTSSGSISSGTSTSGTDNSVSGAGTSDNSSSDSSSSDTGSSYSDLIAAFSYASKDTMSLAVSVDELDINSVETGQIAEVTLDAIEGETYEGTVTKVSSESSSSGSGTAKYEVILSVPKDDQMKSGMNASATIEVESKDDVITIPVSALQEKGNKVFVYTENSGDGTLSGEQEVTTGISDGTNVEITEGLSEGDVVYYQKTGNTSNGSGKDSGQSQGPGGDMPQGGDGNGGGPQDGNGNSGGMPQGAPGGGQ